MRKVKTKAEFGNDIGSTYIRRDDCEICGSSHKTTLISTPFTDPRIWNFIDTYYDGRISKENVQGMKYELAKCSTCEFMWQVYVLSDAYMGLLYSEWISSRDSFEKKKNADLELYVQYSNELQNSIMYLGKRPCDLTMLDYGMGWGYWCQMAKAFGCNVYGYERSSERIEYAVKNGIQVIDSFDDLNKYRFDFINLEQVLEHVVRPRDLLASLAQMLNDNGLVHVGVPNGAAVENEVGKQGWAASKNAVQPLEHINCFTFDTLKNTANSAGLELETESPPIRHSRPYTWRQFVRHSLSGMRARRRSSLLRGTRLYFRKPCID